MLFGKNNQNKNEAEVCKKVAEDIKQFVSTIKEERKDAVAPSRYQFTRLLSELTMARRVPGISARLTENEDYHCTKDEAKVTKSFMKDLFHIDSKESLMAYQQNQFRQSVQYEQFMTFFKGAPLFDLSELNPNGKKAFERCMSIAEAFYPMLEEKGFYAWDICEYIGKCRMALACGIISTEEFDEIVDPFVRKAQVFYHSFKEYALSCLCGAFYFMVVDSGSVEGIEQFIDLQKKVLSMLFGENAPWQYYGWYKPKEREWVALYPGNLGCFITKAAQESGIGFMFHEQGSKDHPDSGWRFFKGDEAEEYLDDTSNIQVVSLDMICNIRPDILAYLEAPIGSAYTWNGKDWNKEQV